MQLMDASIFPRDIVSRGTMQFYGSCLKASDKDLMDLAQLKNGGIMGIMGIRQDREPKKVVIVTEATSPLKDLKDAPRLGWDFG